jgi:hypothetical protein
VTNKEFDLLDELYFVTSFNDLSSVLGWDKEDLFTELSLVIEKGWVKCLDKSSEQEVVCSALDLRDKYEGLFFLASKKGLMEHNTK